jgi:eukaryotic-like serine/threonine-protein kinase
VSVLVDRYVLIERIGQGATGVVWLAHDEKLERDVAVKVLRPSVASDAEQRQRFAREARLLAQLSNDHIVRVFDYVDDGEQAFLVMENVDGVDLGRATAAARPLPVDEAAAYLAPVAQALAYAHRKGVVHRDLTPANVLIERRTGRVVTTDFGMARLARSSGSTLTATGTLIGTPEYWSPEQARGRPTDVATDMYALGCMLFLLLTGRLPFEGDDRLAVGLRRAHEAAPSLRAGRRDAPARVVELVDSLLAHDPADRPTAAAAATELAALRQDARVPVAAARDAHGAAATLVVPAERATAVVPPRAAPSPRRWRPVSVAFALSAAVTLGVLLAFEAFDGSAPRAPRVVGLRETAARTRLHTSVPNTPVRVVRAYSLRVTTGHVIRQEPKAGMRVAGGSPIRLVVSKGTPFANVPTVSTGMPLGGARAALTGAGFTVRYRYTPSWSVRKGAVIELQPPPGTRLRRPARIKLVIASGYPRAVVPSVENASLAAAESQLAAKHLRYHVVYRLDRQVPANQVIGQIPAAGATVYSGTRVRLTVARTHSWQPVQTQTGTGQFESDPFTVPARWRIRYHLTTGRWGAALAQIGWRAEGSFFGGDVFLARGGDPQTHVVSDGAGTYRLAVAPYGGTSWSVEVDAFR